MKEQRPMRQAGSLRHGDLRRLGQFDQRKLIPALYNLAGDGLLPGNSPSSAWPASPMTTTSSAQMIRASANSPPARGSTPERVRGMRTRICPIARDPATSTDETQDRARRRGQRQTGKSPLLPGDGAGFLRPIVRGTRPTGGARSRRSGAFATAW